MAGDPTCTIPGCRQWLHRVRAPTLVVWGDNDGIVTPDYGEKLAAALAERQIRARSRRPAIIRRSSAPTRSPPRSNNSQPRR